MSSFQHTYRATLIILDLTHPENELSSVMKSLFLFYIVPFYPLFQYRLLTIFYLDQGNIVCKDTRPLWPLSGIFGGRRGEVLFNSLLNWSALALW